MKVIFVVGNSGTKHLIVDQLLLAYENNKYSIYEQFLGTKVSDPSIYYESTIEKTMAYIQDYIRFYSNDYDVLIMSGWEINKHVKEIYQKYKKDAEFYCIKLNDEFKQPIDPCHFKNSWDQSPEHIAVRNSMTEILENFYIDKSNWFTTDLVPKIKNLKILPSEGAHKICILSVNK
jgi:hypothetical protein